MEYNMIHNHITLENPEVIEMRLRMSSIPGLPGPHWMHQAPLHSFLLSQICVRSQRSEVNFSYLKSLERNCDDSKLNMSSSRCFSCRVQGRSLRSRPNDGGDVRLEVELELLPAEEHAARVFAPRCFKSKSFSEFPEDFRILWNLIDDNMTLICPFWIYTLSPFDHWIARRLELNQLRLDPVFPA